MNNIYIPLEIWQIILNSIDFLSQIRLRQVSKQLYLLSIHNFYTIPNKYQQLLTNKILLQHPNIKYLDASNNPKITNINHLPLLQRLRASNKVTFTISSELCGISDNSMKQCVNLKFLDASDNPKITNVNHCTKLIALMACDNCGITDYGMSECVNLKSLYSSNNKRITNVNHCTQLQRLYARWHSGISDLGIKDCVDLQVLWIYNNKKITDIRHLVKLQLLATYNRSLKDQLYQIKLERNSGVIKS